MAATPTVILTHTSCDDFRSEAFQCDIYIITHITQNNRQHLLHWAFKPYTLSGIMAFCYLTENWGKNWIFLDFIFNLNFSQFSHFFFHHLSTDADLFNFVLSKLLLLLLLLLHFPLFIHSSSSPSLASFKNLLLLLLPHQIYLRFSNKFSENISTTNNPLFDFLREYWGKKNREEKSFFFRWQQTNCYWE